MGLRWQALGLAILCLLAAGILLLGDKPAQAEEERAEQVLWSPYWTVAPNFTSTLEMKNNLAEEPLTVHVWLYSAGGEEHYLQAVWLQPRQTVVLDLNTAIAALPPATAARLGKEGTAKATFLASHVSNLMGAISVTNPKRGAAWNFRLYPSFAERPVVPVRGLFWLYDQKTDGFVAAQNASDSFITLNPSFHIEGMSHPLPPVSLAPGQHFKLELRKELERLGLLEVTAGGIEFTYQGPGDALKAHGVLFNKKGFSAEIHFSRFDQWDEPRDFTQRTPRFPLGPADPRLGLPAPTVFEPFLLLHNFNRHPLEVNVAVGYRTAEGPQETQIPLALTAGENQVLRLEDYLGAAVPPDAHWASLELGYTDRHNGLAAALLSVSRDGEHSLNSVLNWVVASSNEGWYWRADEDYNTLIAVYNRDAAEATVALSLDYSVDGEARRYDLPERVIPGRATEIFDVGELVAAAVPDEDGDVIPAGVAVGGYRVRKLEPDLSLTLTTEALVLDRRRKSYLSLYNTGVCYNAVSLSPTSLVGPVGAFAQVVLLGFNTAEGVWQPLPTPLYSSQNSSIASVSGFGVVEFRAPGTTTVKGSKFIPEDMVFECFYRSMSDTSPVTVKEVTVSLSQTIVLPGNPTTVTVTALPAQAGQSVSLQAQEVAFSGGHEHLGRPVGSFASPSGTTNSEGRFTTTYTAPQFSGGMTIIATVAGIAGSKHLSVVVTGLSLLGPGANYTLEGATTPHPVNHYGNATAIANLPPIADQYAALFPGSVLEYDDMSLVLGGQFDVGPRPAHPEWQFWQFPHQEHRLGANCDVHKSNVPSQRWDTLEGIFLDNNATFLEEPDHWHLRF